MCLKLPKTLSMKRQNHDDYYKVKLVHSHRITQNWEIIAFGGKVIALVFYKVQSDPQGNTVLFYESFTNPKVVFKLPKNNFMAVINIFSVDPEG